MSPTFLESRMRQIESEDGLRWEAFATEAVVAHGKTGAVLAFRMAAGGEMDTIRSTVTFNSMAAADFALRTMSDRELQRRLALARATL
jgi:hypothetical protein